MDKAVAEKWDNRYRDVTAPGDPCWVLAHCRHLLPPAGRALDLAAGLGANALLLAEQGLSAEAWDCSAVALEKIQGFAAARKLRVSTLQRDVESQPPEPNSFDVIVVSQFLHRPSAPALIAALKPGGLLYYQTFARDKLTDKGPSTADFLLAPNELLQLFEPLSLRFYREDARAGDLALGLRDHAYFVGQRISD